MRTLPKISIVIPSFNKVKYISATFDSIFSQSYPDLEVIVQDGGSTDGTVQVIKRYAQRYPKVLSWESKKDKGQTEAINDGLKRAKGEIFAYINADDVYKKGALKKVGEYFLRKPDALWVAGSGDVIDAKGKEIAHWVTAYKNYLLGLGRFPLLLMVNYLMQPSVFLSRKAFRKYGPFTGTKIGVMEYDLWLKLGKVQMPGVIRRDLSSFRMSGENISSILFRKTLKDDDKVVEKYTDNPVILGLHWLHNMARIVLWLR